MKLSASSSITAVAMVISASASTTSAVKLSGDRVKNGNEMHQNSSRHLEGDGSMDAGGKAPSMEIKWVTRPVVETISPKVITCGDIIEDTTLNEAPGSFHCCGRSDNDNSPAVYFKLEGAFGDTEINLCNSSYDTQVSVFREVGKRGDIPDYKCVGGNDDAVRCDGGSLYTIPGAHPDDVYAVIVHGYNGASGAYELAVNCGTALPDTMDVSLEMAQMMREKEAMMPEMHADGGLRGV